MGGARTWAKAALAGLLLTLAGAAGAQLASPADGVNSPGSAPVVDRARADRLEPSITPAPGPPSAAPAEVTIVPGGEQVAGFKLTRALYMGASLPVAVLDAAVGPFIGKPLTRETLQGVANAVGAVYARSDIAFYAVSIPAQVPAGGQLIVRVVEGRVKDYRLAGMSPSLPTRLIESHMRRLMAQAPLRKSALQRSLSLLRDIPGQTVDARVRQAGQPGDLTLDLIVKRKQVQIGVLIDNSGVSNVVSGVQAQLSVTANGLLREGDSTRVAGYLPFYPDRYQFYALSHSTPIGSDGTSLSANIAHVETRSRDRAIKGEATLAGLTISHPVIRSYRTNLSVSASIDGIDSGNYFLDVRFGDYRSRAIRLGASWSSVGDRNGQAVSAVISRGIDLLGAKPFAGFSETGFAKANMQAVAVRSLSKRLSVKLSAKAQYSRDRLPVTERFALGGRGAGMAFRVGTLTAEQAVAGSAELSWAPSTAPLLKNSALFAYADGAVAHAVARPVYRLPAQDFSLASVGGGVRVGIGPQWRASAELAVPVKRPDSVHSRKARFFFGLSRTF